MCWECNVSESRWKCSKCILHDNKQQQRRPTPSSEDSNRSTYVQGSVVLGNHTVGSVPTDIREDQEMDVILFWFRSHTEAPCRQIRKTGEASSGGCFLQQRPMNQRGAHTSPSKRQGL